MSKNLLFSVEDPKRIGVEVRGIFTEMQSGLSDLINTLPEALRPQFKKLKDKTDAVLVGLASQPTDQIPQAQEANYAMRSLAWAMQSAWEQYQSAMEVLQGMGKMVGGLQAEMQSLQGLKQEKETGVLIPKTQAEQMVKDAVAAVTQKAARISARRTELQTLGLPLPDDAALDVEDAAFGTLKEAGKKRLTKLTELGLASELQSGELVPLVYGSEPEFQRAVKIAEKAGAGAGAGRRAGAARGAAEPLLGGSGGGGGGAAAGAGIKRVF